MDWIWEKTLEFWCSFFEDSKEKRFPEDLASPPASHLGYQSAKKAKRVRFSRSTVRRLRARDLEQLGSTNPFFNFLLMQRIRQEGLVGLDYLKVVRQDKRGPEELIWNSMDERQRAPYLQLAKNIHRQQSEVFQDRRKLEERGYRIRRSLLAKIIEMDENAERN